MDGHVTDMCATSNEHESNMNRTSIEHRSNMNGRRMGDEWEMNGTSMGEMKFAKFAEFAKVYFARVAAMLLMLVTMSVGQVWGDCTSGFENGNIGIKLWYNPNNVTNEIKHGRDNVNATDIGEVTSLYLKEYFVQLYQSCDNLSGGTELSYRIYKYNATPSGSYTNHNGNWGTWGDWSNGYRYPKFGNNNLNDNLLSGLAGGKYTIQYYFKALGANGGADIYCNNGNGSNDGNFKVNFTYKKSGAVGDLVAIDDEYTFTPTAALAKGYLYEYDRVFSISDNDNGFSNNKLQINSNRKIAIKVNAGATVTITYTANGSRAMQMGSTSGGTEYGTSTDGTLSHYFASASTIYISASNELYMSRLQVSYSAPAPTTYTLTYAVPDKTSGDVPAAVGSLASGANVTLDAATGFSRTGYTFNKWNDGSTNYIASANYTMPAKDVTMTATWTAKQTHVTFDKNGGRDGQGECYIHYGDNSQPRGWEAPTWAGHTFEGYFDAATDGTKYFNADGSAAKAWDIEDATKTLYAHWTGDSPTPGGCTDYFIHWNAASSASDVKCNKSNAGNALFEMAFTSANRKDESFTYKGDTYSKGIKLESSTVVTYTPKADGIVVLYFLNSNQVKINDVTKSLTDNKYQLEVTKNTTYTIKRAGSENSLYIIEFTCSGPTYYIKHNWNGAGGTWPWKQLNDNGDGTYSRLDQYGSSGCNWNTANNDTGAKWIASPSLVGAPAKGDWCEFTLDPTAGTITITKVPTAYYVYLGETLTLPAGHTYAKGTATPAQYASTLTPEVETERYEDGNVLSGNTYRCNTLGQYVITADGTMDITVYVYRYYAKHPWSTCETSKTELHNKSWVWRAMDRTGGVRGDYGKVLEIGGAITGANVAWDYAYDWDGLYQLDGADGGQIEPATSWADGTPTSTGGHAWKTMDIAGLECGTSMIEFVYSGIPATSTTAPAVSDDDANFSGTKVVVITYYTLTFGSNPIVGGAVSTDWGSASPVKVEEHNKVKFSALAADGYTFEGWYGNAECTGEKLGTDLNYVIEDLTENKTVYAKFEQRPCFSMTTPASPSKIGDMVVTGGTISDKNISTKPLTFNGDGVNFSGSAAQLQVTLEENISVGTKVTIYYKNTSRDKTTAIGLFDSNVSNKVAEVTGITSGTSGNVSYTFTAENTAYIGKNSFVITRNSGAGGMAVSSILVAGCGAATYSVTYDGNGATGGAVPVDGTAYGSGNKATVKDNTGSLVRTGYTFSGWNTKANGSGTDYAAGGTISGIDADVTLYAKWSAKTTTVTIDANTANHGSTTPGDVIATVGQALPAFTAATGEANYSLKGYYTAAVGGNLVINADGTLVASVAGYTDANKKWLHDADAVTLYAQYEKVNTACASVVINYSKTGGQTSAVAPSEYAFTAEEATVNACSVVAGHIDGSKNRELVIAKDYGFKFLAGKIYLKVTFDTPLADGDRIEITATDPGHEFYLTTNNATYPTSGNKITSGQSYTVEEGDGLIDSQVLYIWRGKGETMYLRTIDRICSTGCKKPGLAYATATVTKSQSDGDFINKLTNTNGVDVVYSSSNTAVATVNATTGEVHIVGGGTTTIKATAAEQTKGGTTYCEREVSYVLNVCATTAITTQPADAEVGRGDNHTLSVVATGTNLSYQWMSCDTEGGTYTEVKGATSASYTFAALDNRYYYCKITNGCGVETPSNKAHITLSTGAPTFTWTIAETVYKGQQVPFTVQTNSDATLTVGSVTLTGGSGNSLQNVTVNGNTITGTLVVNTTNTTGITLHIATTATGNFNEGSDDKEIEISETCPSAGTEVVYSFQVNSSTQNVTTAQTAVGGTATLGNSSKLGTSDYTASGYAYKLDGNPGAANTKYVLVTLNSALKVGDVVTIKGYVDGVSDAAHFLISRDVTATNRYAELANTEKNAEQLLSFTVNDAATGEGATSFYISRKTSSVYFSGITITSSGKVGSLQWEDSELGDGEVVVKKIGDANFTNVAIATSAGAISYSSGTPSVASVNSSTGEVTIKSTGRATITASLAENGCYSAQTITYIVEVQSDCTAPTITGQPADANYEVGAVATALSVTASGTSLTYQWYSNTTKSNENGTVLTGKTESTYTPATTAKGTYYYYCVVTSETYCSTASEVATITVTKTCGERDAPKIIVTAHTGTELCWQTITLKAVKQDGSSEFETGTYVWYKDDEVIAGQTEKTLVVNEAGTYYVEHDVDGCPMESSNRAYVEHKDAMAQRLTPFQYYHEYKVDDKGNQVDWTYSDQMKNRHLFAVRGLSKVNEKTYEVSASLKQDAGDASPADKTTEVKAMLEVVPSTTDASVDTLMLDLNKLASLNMEVGNELVISVAPYNCHGAAEAAQSITIYVIDEKPALAFIVPGADGEGTKTKKDLVIGGDFLTGYNKADLKTQTSTTEVSEVELPLYTALKANFHVTPVNGYAPFNKLNYEPFDLVFLTDFVKTDGSGDKDAAKKKVNDLGQLVDYRPLFSTKCHMSGIDNWKKVGFTANPIVPKQTQLHMNIVCYAHPMFEGMATDGFNIFQDYEEQNETVFKMISDGGYDKGKGVQGFELSAAENFVIVAQTHHDAHGEVVPENPHMLRPVVGGEDKILVASCERQANVEARMILLSLNADATSKLTPAGIDVIVRSLNYLMEIRQIKVTDCHFEFDDATGDHLWSTPGNWAPRHSVLPTKNVNVRIAKNCTVDSKDAVAGGMKIMDGVTVTINADAALQLTGMARHLEDGELSPTGAGELIVLAGADGSGAFIHGDEAAQTGATVQFYSISGNALKGPGEANDVDKIQWQWMTTPFAVNQASTNYDGAWMYAYTNSTHQWNPVVNTYSMMYAFHGYEITQDVPAGVGNTYTMTGTLASTANQDIELYSGLNLIGNSWTAPINIEAMTTADFENAEATIVMFNTGNDGTGSGAVTTFTDFATEDVTTPGTYVSIPVNTASVVKDKLKVIPAMQAFEVRTNKGENGTLHLDYDRIVRKSGNVNIQPMRAPSRAMADMSETNGIYSTLRIYVQGSRYGDFLYIYRNDETTMDFDNGWDGRKYMSSNLNIPVLMVRYGTTNWQISTQPEFVGTQLAFYQGEDNVYTMGFQYDGEETLWLYDSTEDTYTEINNATTYTFTSNTTKLQKRFVIVGYNPNAPQNPGVATGVDDVSPSNSGPRKLILNDKLFILNNGRLYDATGRLAY